MESAMTLGMVAGVLTTAAFVPQVVKIWKLKRANDISMGTFAIFSLGVTMWLLYGIELDSMPLILANGVTLVLSLTIIFFKLKFK